MENKRYLILIYFNSRDLRSMYADKSFLFGEGK